MTRTGLPPMVAGNWKMNTTIAEGVELARSIGDCCATVSGVEVAVLPPFVHLVSVREVLAPPLLLGAQDVDWHERGAFTGEVSAEMLSGLCDLVLVGHSERRHVYGESDGVTARKFVAARERGLRVIVAVGETEAERDAGHTADVVARQLMAVLAECGAEPPRPADWLVAYEPVWAIGTGRTATPEQAEEVCAHIHSVLSEAGATPPRVLYGGSVIAGNAADLFACASIDGGLLGGASLDPEAFAAIVGAAATAAA